MWVFVAFVGLSAISGLMLDGDKTSPPTPAEQAPPAPTSAAIEAAKKALQAENSVKGVFYDPAASAQWEIGMVNNGSSRVGFANYVCDLLKEHQAAAADTKVKIIDIANLLVAGSDRNNRGMGTVACEDYSVLDGGDLSHVSLSNP